MKVVFWGNKWFQTTLSDPRWKSILTLCRFTIDQRGLWPTEGAGQCTDEILQTVRDLSSLGPKGQVCIYFLEWCDGAYRLVPAPPPPSIILAWVGSGLFVKKEFPLPALLVTHGTKHSWDSLVASMRYLRQQASCTFLYNSRVENGAYWK